MNPTTLLLFLLLSALPPSFSDSSDDQRVAKCVPGNCGTITNIIYPFWVSDQQSPYCGFPEFKLDCDGDTLSFQTSNIKYYVHNIFYVNHSILVVPEFDRGLQSSDCPLYQNMAFNLTPFTASLTNMYLFMIYNCTVPQQPFYYKFPCTEYNLSTFLGSNSSELEQFEWFKKCKVVEIPVLGFLGAKASDYNRLVKDGFLLEWSAADCSNCNASGGQCGYNADRETFRCICNDRTHEWHCNDGTTPYKHSIKTIVWMTVLSVSISCISIGSFLCWRRHKGREKRSQEQSILLLGAEIARSLQETNKSTPEFTLFDFPRIVQATDSFSTVNKLGQGGFGAVYKGVLAEDKEIAVKRLSTHSGQGLEEFKNEILLISKLQHRNLVRLLGCCIQRDEKILIYEYMPNKSLDFFLFDRETGAQLDWIRRFHIIEGIAQGLIYLHKHSRLQIIHRDLKVSNVLLDADMNPKISDFGLARIFNPKETIANTIRVAGTYGYMAPEYVTEGLFSVKSDVFSFGVLLLEIISGKRNTSFHRHNNSYNLVGYAWELWKEGKLLDLIDPLIGDEFSVNETTRCIHVGLLCVQENAADRPTMTQVITMLSSETAPSTDPKQPAFFTVRIQTKRDLPQKTSSANNLSVTSVDGR